MNARISILSLLVLAAIVGCRDTSGPRIPEAASIEISVDSVRLLAPGDSAHLVATVADTLGAPLADLPVDWSSSDTSIATVSGSGVVIAVGYGSAEIRASAVGRSAQVPIAVGEAGVASWSVARAGGITGEGLADVWTDPQGNVFAVGRAGTVLRFDGQSWTTLDTGTGEDLWKISGSSSSNLYVIAGSLAQSLNETGPDKILHFDGSRWTTVYDAAGRGSLTSVWVAPNGEVFAVGFDDKDADYRALFVHWNGNTWEESYIDLSPSYLVLNDVWGSSSSDVYAVGAYASGGIIFHFDGTSWTRLEGVPTIEAFGAVGGSGPDDVWAAGAESLIVHFDGGDWSRLESPTRIFAGSVWSTSASDAYISGYSSTAGSTIVLHYDGSVLSQLPTPPHVFSDPLPGTARSLSDSYLVSNRGTVLRLTDGSWTTLQYGPRLLDVSGTEFGRVVVVGTGTTAFTLERGEWSAASTPRAAGDLTAVLPDPEGDFFVLTTLGAQYRLDGEQWTLLRSYGGGGYVDAWRQPGGSIFATRSRYQGSFRDLPYGWVRSIFEIVPDGNPRTAWTSGFTPDERTMQGIAGRSASEAYAVGAGGLIVGFDGSTWKPVQSGTDLDLYGVGGTGGAFFAVGESGIILRLVDGLWSPVESGTTATLRAVWGSSESNVYAVGDQGTIVRFDGVRWNPMVSGTTARLNAVWGEDGSVYVAGDRGVILKGR